MIARYSQQPDPDFYSWGAMAAAQRYTTTHDPRFLAFLRGQAQLFLTRFRGRLEARCQHCAEMEGIASTLGVLDAEGGTDAELVLRLQTWAAGEAAKLPRLQVRTGQEGLDPRGRCEAVGPSHGAALAAPS